MALSTQRASSSSLAWAEPPPRWKFDVFLSFRGVDTRRGFISHLYRQLEMCQLLKTFIDDRELEIGSEISPELLNAIQHSHLAIVVLSPDYASSTWCLEELAKIIESMDPRDKRVLPVFLNVDPSDVRHQRNSFAEAFAKHRVRFSNDPNKVERWRQALTNLANLSGYDVRNYKCEGELIEFIVKRVWEKVGPTFRLTTSEDRLVGIDFRLPEMGLLLALEEKDVRFIGVWGMGGVGKTTLAQLVYERISYQFQVAEFLVVVKNSHGQLVKLQKQILYQALRGNVSQVWNEHTGTVLIRKLLSNKKVLLVVDDLDSSDLLKELAGHESWFGEGSRIIVTTRDQRVLVENDIEISFKLSGLNDSEALELFCQEAFKKDQPEEGFSELTKCFIDYVEGLPLALKIVGRSLYKRDLEEWESAWDKLKKGSDPKVFNSLKISYDTLDYMEKNIFLDVAFFHMGMNKARVIELLKSSGFSGRYGIEVLIEKSLITIDWDNNVGMHGLVQEMAWEIVRKDSDDHDEPGRHSRLCHRHDIFRVFITNTGTEKIEGICLRLLESEQADPNWNVECFSKMLRLRFLEFDNLIISSGPKFLPNTLIILRWTWFPSKSLPSCFRPNLLAELKMWESKLVKLWDGRLDFPNLKLMDLRLSKYLKKTPDFTGTPKLEELHLGKCEGLVEVHPSIAAHKKLKRFILKGCKNLRSFPSKIEMDSLEDLILPYCSQVRIPEFGEGMKKLSWLYIPGTATTELPSSIEHLVGLRFLTICRSKSLRSLLGSAIFKLKSLKDLSIYRCPKLKVFVENTGETGYLKPSMRSKLGSLLFRRKSLEPSLPSPRALPNLRRLKLSDCHLCQGIIPVDIGYCLPSLSELYLGGNNFITLPSSMKCLSQLRYIDLTWCKRLQQLPDLPSNKRLQVLADECDSLKKLSEPSQQGTSTNLEFFDLTTVNCFGLIDNEGSTNGIFSMLRRLAAQGISPGLLSYSPLVHRSFDILCPGSRISEWFDIQSEEGSLIVELPPDRESCKSEWMGILFCVVFADQKEPHTLECDQITIQCLSPAIREKRRFCLTTPRHMMGDHLWVSFMPHGLIQDTISCSFTFSFNAYCFGISHIPCPNCVKRCGARLLYEEDLKLLNPQTNIMKRSREYCDSKEAEVGGEGPSKIASGSSNKESFFKRLKA